MSGEATGSTPAAPGTDHLVLYDGDCPLCHRSVRWLLRIDRRRRLQFAPLQGVTAAAVIDRAGLPDDLDSVLFVEHPGSDRERVFARSTGVLRALAAIGGGWRVVSWLRLVPRPLRDAVYDFVARRRNRWYGRLDGCPLPAPEERDRFLA